MPALFDDSPLTINYCSCSFIQQPAREEVHPGEIGSNLRGEVI